MTETKTWPSLPLGKITFTRDCRCFKTGYELEFTAPITLLVGEIGTGKSTLLDLLRYSHGVEDDSYLKGDSRGDFKDAICVAGEGVAEGKVKYFDFHSGDRKFAATFGECNTMSGQLEAMHVSSGQGLAYQFKESGMLAAQQSLLLVDEIGRGSSPRMQETYRQILIKLVLEGNQIIASTHSERIMGLEGEEKYQFEGLSLCRLYSVENRAYMTRKTFLKRHLERK